MDNINLLDAAKAYKRPAKKMRGRLGKLARHVEVIKYLRSARHFTFHEITSFFVANGIKVTDATVMKTWKQRAKIRTRLAS